MSEQELECQNHANCGDYCNKPREREMVLCESCLDSYDQQQAYQEELRTLRAEAEALWSTYIALVDKLGIDTEKAKTADGKPSDVIVSYVEALRAENARLRQATQELSVSAEFKQTHEG